MQGRTFIRTMMELIFNNALFRSVMSLVNFCNEQRYYNSKELKFLKKMPIKHVEASRNKNYLFQMTK